MSFGFSVGDFITVGTFACHVSSGLTADDTPPASLTSQKLTVGTISLRSMQIFRRRVPRPLPRGHVDEH
jgi:hypothetical protein